MGIRIFTSQPIDQASLITLDSVAAHHLSTVLRKNVGFSFNIFNGNGAEFSAQISNIEKKEVEVKVVKLLHTEATAVLKFNLFIALSKGERMEFALQKAVELGIHSITPIISERTVVKLSADRLKRKMQHWQKIIISACEQSGRCLIPTLSTPQPIQKIIASPPAGLSLLLDPQANNRLNQLKKPLDAVNLIVGPEGGFSESEQQGLVNVGFKGVRLGPRILRTETAPLAALAAMQALWGDFRI